MSVELLQQSGARAETIFHLGSMCFQGEISDEILECFEEEGEDIWPVLEIENVEEIEQCSGWERSDLIAEALFYKGKTGFLCKIAHPVPRNISSDGSFNFSWGSYTWKWVYAESFDDVCAKGAAWADKYVAEKRASAA